MDHDDDESRQQRWQNFSDSSDDDSAFRDQLRRALEVAQAVGLGPLVEDGGDAEAGNDAEAGGDANDAEAGGDVEAGAADLAGDAQAGDAEMVDKAHDADADGEAEAVDDVEMLNQTAGRLQTMLESLDAKAEAGDEAGMVDEALNAEAGDDAEAGGESLDAEAEAGDDDEASLCLDDLEGEDGETAADETAELTVEEEVQRLESQWRMWASAPVPKPNYNRQSAAPPSPLPLSTKTRPPSPGCPAKAMPRTQNEVINIDSPEAKPSEAKPAKPVIRVELPQACPKGLIDLSVPKPAPAKGHEPVVPPRIPSWAQQTEWATPSHAEFHEFSEQFGPEEGAALSVEWRHAKRKFRYAPDVD